MNELQLLDNGEPIDTVDFGRPETGSINQKTLYIHNTDKLWPINNIKLDMVSDPDIKIEYPESLKPNESKEVRISWTPQWNRRTQLNISQLFTGELLVG